MPAGGARRSRFVNLMKLVLPLVAGGLIAVVIVWPQLSVQREGFRVGLSDIRLTDTGGQRLVNARYQGTDSETRPFSITAALALQPSSEDRFVQLTNPQADILIAAESWLALTAKSGRYNRREQVLHLSGDISLFHDSGYEFRTEAARIDFPAGAADGDTPVRGQGPFGELQAAGFQVRDGGDRVIFKGKARLVLYPGGGA